MKKILSFVIVMSAVAMVSCGGNSSKKAAEATATDAKANTEATVKCDSTACDSTKCVEKCDSIKNCDNANVDCSKK